MSDTCLSQKAFDELKEKLKYMKVVKRKEIAKSIGTAIEQGDLKENAGYHEAKKDQSLNEARIKMLEEDLRNVKIIDNKNIPKDKVKIGLTVKLKNLDQKETLEYTIVSEPEADIFQNKISPSSPLGSALLGCKEGELVEFEAPSGLKKYKILKIS